jgi:hypothetical protein
VRLEGWEAKKPVVSFKAIKRRRRALFEKRERWGLTLWGRLAVVIAAGVALLGTVPMIHGFLATEHAVRGEILVVEGWIPDYAIPGAISEFEKNGYLRLVCVGGPILSGSHLAEVSDYAELGRARLKRLGFSEERLVVLKTDDIRKDRTYGSGLAVKRWISSSGTKVQGLDIYTLGAHARRSRLLFQIALGHDLAVGVIAANDQTYDSNHWWRSSNGVRTVLSELIAYMYAVIFFHP